MNNSNFTNPHGLNEKNHYSTLYDIALLIDALYEDFPQYGHYLGIKRFKYGDRVIENSNPLIKASYDGIVVVKPDTLQKVAMVLVLWLKGIIEG